MTTHKLVPIDLPPAMSRILASAAKYGTESNGALFPKKLWAELLEAAPPVTMPTEAAGDELRKIAIDIAMRFALDAMDVMHVSTEAIYKGGLVEKIVDALTARPDQRDAVIEACLAAQPSTAENPNEDSYQRGRFDGIMEYGRAIRALRSSPPTQDERTDLDPTERERKP